MLDDRHDINELGDDEMRLARCDEYGYCEALAAMDELRENHILAKWLGPQSDGRLREWDDLTYTVAQEEVTELDELLESADSRERHEILVAAIDEMQAGELLGGMQMARKRHYEDGQWDVVVEDNTTVMTSTESTDGTYDDAGYTGRKVKKRSTWRKPDWMFGNEAFMAAVEELVEGDEAWGWHQLELLLAEEQRASEMCGAVRAGTVSVDSEGDMRWLQTQEPQQLEAFMHIEPRGVEMVSIRERTDHQLWLDDVQACLIQFAQGMRPKVEQNIKWKVTRVYGKTRSWLAYERVS